MQFLGCRNAVKYVCSQGSSPDHTGGELTVFPHITIIAITFSCCALWKSNFMAMEKLGKLRKYFCPTLWPA